MCKCAADCPTPGNNARYTITTTYLVALHAVLGKLGLMASHTVEVLPFREEASGPNDLLAVAAGEAVFMPDGALVLHVLVSCRGKQSDSHTDRLCRGLHPLSSPACPRGEGMQTLQSVASLNLSLCVTCSHANGGFCYRWG